MERERAAGMVEMLCGRCAMQPLVILMKLVKLGDYVMRQVVGKGSVVKIENVTDMTLVPTAADDIGTEGPEKDVDLWTSLAMMTCGAMNVIMTLDNVLAASITVAPRVRVGPMEVAEM